MSTPVYLSGLRLVGRKVVVVGGGSVAQRRIPALLAAGADVHVVSPQVTPAIEGMYDEITWIPRRFEDHDLDGAWYVVAATDDPLTNEQVSVAAEARHTFCVRSDDGLRATAWTPATGRHGSLTVGVVGDREPRLSARVRDHMVTALRDGLITTEQPDWTGVMLVGGGPGDPDLITVAGYRALMQADVVVADRLAPRELLSALPSEVELIDVTKLPRGRAAAQEAINQVLVERAMAGMRVVRLKGGDNYVFGRGYEEVLACQAAGVKVQVIPGLTSALSVPAVAGIPVTHRRVAHGFTVVSGHLAPGDPGSLVDWEALGACGGTIVLLMAVANAGAIAEALQSGGRAASPPVAVISDGTMPTQRQRLTTLAGLAEVAAQVRPPAIMVIGEVVSITEGV